VAYRERLSQDSDRREARDELSSGSAIVLFGPLLFPIARMLGVHEVHYAMVVIFAMGLGLFAPPFGVGFYAACAIGKVSPDVAMPRVWPHMAALFLAMLLLTLVPWFSIGFL
jgi:TRAP-type C4-dicarboxylate transport system permease large subunit